MKSRLTLTIEKELVSFTKKYARSKGMSVSQLVEQLLRGVAENGDPSFSSCRRGKFLGVEDGNQRMNKLKTRYLN